MNKWFPLCRVAILHSSGSHSGPKYRLISKIGVHRRHGSVLITSYSTYTVEHKAILKTDWHYATITLKELRTPHRLILSGSPMQNNLKNFEFLEKFSVPITQGGYANATAIQVRTAYKCACVLRDAIAPYMLRRMKKDVEMVLQLPEKTEQILFCEITECQRALYEIICIQKNVAAFCPGKWTPCWINHTSKAVQSSRSGQWRPNKHDEYDVKLDPEMEFGAASRSGKLIVIKSLLRLWSEQKQKVLLFSQSKQMLTILEKFVILEGIPTCAWMVPRQSLKRQGLVEKFNKEENVFVFLLTTRVGGLGVNLTGANRVVIFDPDWNPATDMQARERAWRIGQTRNVTVYRLLSSGTIEEKIYQRQIFKHFLTNKVLADPKQQRFFKTNDLHELFTLGSTNSKKHGTETAAIFSSTVAEVTKKNFFDQRACEKNPPKQRGKRKAISPEPSKTLVNLLTAEYDEELPMDDQNVEVVLSEHKKQQLQLMAKKMAANLDKYVSSKVVNDSEAVSKKSRRASRKKVGLLDGAHKIPFLAKQRNYQPKEDTPTNKEQDDFVLHSLLKNSGVTSALRHDHIISSGSASDIQLVEDEADTVARRAAEVLKRSRRVHDQFVQNVSSSNSSKLFGTKQSSDFAAEANIQSESSNKSTASGSSLLQSIRLRKEKMLDNNLPSSGQEQSNMEGETLQNYPSLVSQLRPHTFTTGDRYEKLAEDVRAFFVKQNGRASTSEVLFKFKNKVAPSDSFAFRVFSIDILSYEQKVSSTGEQQLCPWQKNAVPKGGSSSSNPKTNLHRVAANNARILKKMPFIAIDEKAIGNSSDDLIKSIELNSMSLELGNKAEAEDDIISISESVARSDFTHFTNCTNPTFNPVHREWKSGSKLHAEVVSVLAAVAEVIRQNGGTETDVEYFGALLSSLQSTPNNEYSKVAAIAYLLHLNAKKVSKPVLLKLFSQATKIICTKMNGMRQTPMNTHPLP
uniref:DNA repair and recombination protein RAD54-like n=1 Tax=Ditylenchus dipsaci TaxID=166011 RepID=A0A915ECN9_9BILA